MSESEYRDAREAARARVVALESKLQEHDASATRTRDSSPSKYAGEKRALRDRLGRIAKARGAVQLAIAVVIGGIGRFLAIRGSTAAGVITILVAATILLTMVLRKRKPRGKELRLEQRLQEIIEIEDAEYARFRVENEPARKRIDEDRERLERELEEARAMATAELRAGVENDETAKNETKKN